MKQLAFLLYDSRSGSTLFSSLLNRYRGVTVSLESAFVSRILEYRGKLISPQDFEELIEYLLQELQFQELRINTSSLLASYCNLSGPVSKGDLIRATIESCFLSGDQESIVWVIKHPPYYYLETIVDDFPKVKFIHLVRDGRAVLNSKLGAVGIHNRSMERSVLKAALDWRHKLELAEVYAHRSVTVRYEDILSEPDLVLDEVLSFLDVPDVGRELTKSQNDYSSAIGQLQSGLHSNVSKLPQKEFSSKWKHQMKSDDIYVYEFICWRSLLQYNYVLYRINQQVSFIGQVRRWLVIIQHTFRYFTVKVGNVMFTLFRGGKFSDKVNARLLRFKMYWLPFIR